MYRKCIVPGVLTLSLISLIVLAALQGCDDRNATWEADAGAALHPRSSREVEYDDILPPQVWGVTVSPDGTLVAFGYITELHKWYSRSDLWVVRTDGTNAHPLCSGIPGQTICGRWPAWLLNSEQVVSQLLSRSRGADIALFAVDGKEHQFLTNTDEIVEASPAPSPNGEWLAYYAFFTEKEEQPYAVPHLCLLHLESGRVLLVKSERPITALQSPTWRSDSSEVLFLSRAASDGPVCIRAVALEGLELGEVRTLLEHPKVEGFTVSPDDQWIAYCVATQYGPNPVGDLYLARMDSPVCGRRIVRDAVVGTRGAVQWTHDGTYVYYIRQPDGHSRTLWKTNIASDKHTKIAENVGCLAHGNPWTNRGQIVFTRKAGQIWAVTEDGAQQRLIFAGSQRE